MSIEHSTTISAMIVCIMNYLSAHKFSQSSCKRYKHAFSNLQSFYGDPMMPYSPQITVQFLEHINRQYKNGDMSKGMWYMNRRAAIMTDDFYKNGEVTIGGKPIPYTKKGALSKGFNNLLSKYDTHLKQKNYKDKTIAGYKNAATFFMHYLETMGIYDISKVTNKITADFIPFAQQKWKASMGKNLPNTRYFLEFLSDQNLIDKFVPEALHVSFPTSRKIRHGFTNDEIQAMLSIIDRSTNIGKRDYAILFLAAHTGLRSVDIRQLKLKSIKWEQGEIQIVQSKTQNPLILPLLEDVGNAISDYILNVRPKFKDRPVFLTMKPPFNGLTDLDDIVSKYAHLSGIAKTTKAPLTIHSFRRGLGLSLLTADIPLSQIMEVLGHTKQNSTKKYLAIDIENLRSCAVPMIEYAPKGDTL